MYKRQALSILESAEAGSYQAAYAVAKGDTLLTLGREDEARAAYTSAIVLASRGGAQVNLTMVQQKLQSLSPVEAREVTAAATAREEAAVEASTAPTAAPGTEPTAEEE